MSILTALAKFEGQYKGQGTNHEKQKFTGDMEIGKVVDEKGFAIRYTAVGDDGTIFHQEFSMIAPDASGNIILWNLNSNVPGMLPHKLLGVEALEEKTLYTFSHNNRDARAEFREEVVLELWKDGDISYNYSWGMPDDDFAERSAIKMVPVS